MKIGFGGRPFPHAEHDVAFDALRPLRLRKGQLAARNAVCPVGEQRDCFLRTKPAQSQGHVSASLTCLESARPRLDRRLNGIFRGSPFSLKCASPFGAESMTALDGVL